MYQRIKAHPSALAIYSDRLVAEGVATPEQVAEVKARVLRILGEAFEAAKKHVPRKGDWLSSVWEGFLGPHQTSRIRNTGVPGPLLKEVGAAITALPSSFTPHKAIARVYDARARMLAGEEPLDWGAAEALAFGTLLAEGNHVRLSGQDVERGTFSHRHAVVHDQKSGERYTPLAHVFRGQRPGQFTVSNSSLSEYGVLGFELGYALENPNSLVLWEAQFGDFANGAQVRVFVVGRLVVGWFCCLECALGSAFCLLGARSEPLKSAA